ncbi:SMP-30/gluconolactonase/LRE family protein [Homoserinibacter sp. GY 40078]|uniref:SMP-30/gluconolactonase/LRE family protein n=1 Tax=Homoserinibacter sp. GY 40078 TaxID=2603275 RepID=UPI0011CC9353|nr:SMP-30/gluconolactonase/LRE family protein [Homoserinibacter sp. GY 40078]TXK18779.1 SMP-30/gluconolactonase/LRE family protein [Homoserinibacter sp. GY 40078]
MTIDATPLAVLEGLGFPEALRWRDGALWFSDMFRGRVMRWTPGEPAETVLDQASGGPEVPGGIGWLPGGGGLGGDLLVVDTGGRRVLRRGSDGTVTTHADLSSFMEHPANDMHVDPDGTAWVGGYGFDPETDAPRASRLVRIDPDGTCAETAAELVFPNGCERAADGTLVVAETFADRVSVLDAEASVRLREVALAPGAGPDGLSIGPDGIVHVALAFAGEVVRIGADGPRSIHRAPAIPDGPGAGPVGCYDCAVHPDGDRIAIAIASLDEPLAARVDTGRIVILPL